MEIKPATISFNRATNTSGRYSLIDRQKQKTTKIKDPKAIEQLSHLEKHLVFTGSDD